MKRQWAIYATPLYMIYSNTGEDVDLAEVVATFDSKEAAEKYIEVSRLKKRYYGLLFKWKSLLRYYRDPEIRVYEVAHPPHNPKVDWK